jgi:4-hydroxy-tetrahydrodipicolinate reductase
VAKSDETVELVAGVDVINPVEGLSYPFYTDITENKTPADAVIVCLPPHAIDAVLATARYCEENQIPMIVCTTALPSNIMDTIKKTAEKTAILVSANMSLGINLLTYLLDKAAKLLYDSGFDIEIIEKHHNQKLDAPSGTAYLLADTLNQTLGGQMRYVHDRNAGKTKRGRDEIGLHALRGGTITGEHTVVFAGLDEVVELTHIAQSRDVFAVGALKAAKFIKGKAPGYYTMLDLIHGL